MHDWLEEENTPKYRTKATSFIDFECLKQPIQSQRTESITKVLLKVQELQKVKVINKRIKIF